MKRTKFGLLSLCAVIFGVMAFSASAAQALPEWMVNNVNQSKWAAELLVKLQVKEIETLKATGQKHAILLTSVLGKKVELLCTGAELESVHLAAAGTLTHGNVAFTGCITKIDGVLQEKCKPKGNGAPLGTILTNKGEGKIVLHEPSAGVKESLIEINPIELNAKGEVKLIETFVTVELGATCAIGETLPVRGKLFIKDCTGNAEKEALEHLIEQGPLTELWVLNKTAEHTATIDGSALVKLIGVHENMTWSGLAA